MKTARFLKNITDEGRNWKLYEVSPPQEVYNVYNYSNALLTNHVIVSASVVPGSGPETYIFACDSTGHVTCWTEMNGSERGADGRWVPGKSRRADGALLMTDKELLALVIEYVEENAERDSPLLYPAGQRAWRIDAVALLDFMHEATGTPVPDGSLP